MRHLFLAVVLVCCLILTPALFGNDGGPTWSAGEWLSRMWEDFVEWVVPSGEHDPFVEPNGAKHGPFIEPSGFDDGDAQGESSGHDSLPDDNTEYGPMIEPGGRL